MKQTWRNYKDFKAEMLKNKEVKKLYDDLSPEFDLIAKNIRKQLKQRVKSNHAN